MSRKSVLLGLFAIAAVLAAITAVVMVRASSYMNGAADYARAHAAELTVPEPLPGSEASAEPPTLVESVARYGDTVEVQITRRYSTARSTEALFTVTYFYAPVGDAWQVVASPESFWGATKTTAGTRAVVTHPQRDQKLIDNLIVVLDTALNEACTRWECPPVIEPVQVRFVTDPASIGPLTYLVPRIIGVPRSREANTDYLSRIAADAIASLAAQLNKSPADAQAEIVRQTLYWVP